jgi:hypothetical protein
MFIFLNQQMALATAPLCSFDDVAKLPIDIVKSNGTHTQTNNTNVQVLLRINKIYDINPQNETFRLDANLIATWIDKTNFVASLPFQPHRTNNTTEDIFKNKQLSTLIAGGLWLPNIELVNALGAVEVIDSYIKFSTDGGSNYITYNEQFDMLVTSSMNLRNFPFDKQVLILNIESFTYPIDELEFIEPKIKPGRIEDFTTLVEGDWSLRNTPTASVSNKQYKNVYEYFSNVSFRINIQRNADVYTFKLFLPYCVIIFATWCVLWMKSLTMRMGLYCAVSLSMVVYYFYTRSLIPNLPYITFVDQIIMVGAISICLILPSVISQYLMSQHKQIQDSILTWSQRIIPLGAMAILLIIIYGNYGT